MTPATTPLCRSTYINNGETEINNVNKHDGHEDVVKIQHLHEHHVCDAKKDKNDNDNNNAVDSAELVDSFDMTGNNSDGAKTTKPK